MSYPKIEINLNSLRHNINHILKMTGELGIDVAGVIKGVNGIPECSLAYQECGAKYISSSRLEHIEAAREAGVTLPALLVRIPMLSEVERVIDQIDMSLNSELIVLKELAKVASEKKKKHSVILMADLGDLREGFFDLEEIIATAEYVENECEYLYLAGIGTNLGCYGAIDATPEKMNELIAIAEKIEEKIGRRLDYISGGGTTSLPMVRNKTMPSRINHLRVGEGILVAVDLPKYWGVDMGDMKTDVCRLHAEVVELKVKPSHPIGNIVVDAFGNTPTYIDRGTRARAIVAVGKVDYGSPSEIFPTEEGIEVIGASSDHTILDVEDFNGKLKIGDIITFDIDYASIVYVTNCPGIAISFV